MTNKRVLKIERRTSGDAVEAMPGFFQGNVQLPLAFYDIPDAAQVTELVTQLRQARPEG